MCDPENWVAQERDEELAARDQRLPPEDDRPSRAELAEDERQTAREDDEDHAVRMTWRDACGEAWSVRAGERVGPTEVQAARGPGEEPGA